MSFHRHCQVLEAARAADDLAEHAEWNAQLHELGEVEVKHAVRVRIVSLHSDDVRNPQLPKKFQALKKQRTRIRWTNIATALLLLAASWPVCHCLKRERRDRHRALRKSIAVLWFENLSEDKSNAYFPDDIPD